MSSPPNLVFHPAEGSLLDLESLLAIAQGPSRLLSAWMGLHLPAGGGVVLSGLEPEGSLMDLVTPGKGAFGAVSPGVVRPRLTPEGLVTLRPGAALVMTREGAHQLVRVTEPVAVRPPAPSKMIHKPVLVMIVETRPGGAEDLPAGLCARATLNPTITLVPEDRLSESTLPLARPIGDDGALWATDLQRFWQPDHPALAALCARLDDLQRAVWSATPHGSVFHNDHFGKEWTRYQTVATAALQAARLALVSRPMHSHERARVLEQLMRELKRSVETQATELLQVLGGDEAKGHYAALRDRVMGGAK
jgi:hypothetical protein